MTTRKLEKIGWRSFLDGVSKLLKANVAEIEVVSLPLSEQVQAEWLPLIAILASAIAHIDGREDSSE